LKAYRQKLLKGKVPIEDLIITKHLSKNPQHYKQHVSQVITTKQLLKEGLEVHAGKNVSSFSKI
jgi:DNA polymerase elongation subunit (family B)